VSENIDLGSDKFAPGLEDTQNIQINDLKTAAEFISQLHGATLNASGLSPSMIQWLHNCPPESPLGLDQSTQFSIKLFIATLNSS